MNFFRNIGRIIGDVIVSIVRVFNPCFHLSYDESNASHYTSVTSWNIFPNVLCLYGCDLRVKYELSGARNHCFDVKLVVVKNGNVIAELSTDYSFNKKFLAPVEFFQSGEGKYSFQLQVNGTIVRESLVHVLPPFPVLGSVQLPVSLTVTYAGNGRTQATASISSVSITETLSEKPHADTDICFKAVKLLFIRYVRQEGSRLPSFDLVNIKVFIYNSNPRIFALFENIGPEFVSSNFNPPIVIDDTFNLYVEQTREELPYVEGEQITWIIELVFQC